MLNQALTHLKTTLSNLPHEDSILLKNQTFEINKDRFSLISSLQDSEPITFVDGGIANILTAANFNLALIRIASLTLHNLKRIKQHVEEFYLLTTINSLQATPMFRSKIFGSTLIDPAHLSLKTTDPTIKMGLNNAPITTIPSLACRFAELALAATQTNVCLDGTLEQTYTNEDIYLARLQQPAALAKSSKIISQKGNAPTILLKKIGPSKPWQYVCDHQTSFIKLHEKSKHVFRFEGNPSILPTLVTQSSDPIFLGYPYGLILIDQLARISKSRANSIKMKLLLNNEHKDILPYLSTTNAHDILDSIK